MSRKPLPPAQRPPDPPQALYTPEQAARLLSVGRTTLYGLMRRGELAFVQVGRLRRITPQALQGYVDRRHQGQLP